ncbi:MAG TPA: cytochrome c peroxidase, partial [Aggregatilineales bacterium]|nr:cytochrome c peroxidase [Aggregatilineales bacterium]
MFFEEKVDPPPDVDIVRKSRFPRWQWFVLVPMMIVIILIVILALLPVETDASIPETEWGVGTDTIEPAWTGLKREWTPVLNVELGNPQLANLGYELFFDPVLSGDNTYSCAHCHHPDRAFADGLPVSVGVSGESLTRNAPTLWNVAFNTHFFWDGRASSLEEQLVIPITEPHEMNQNFSDLIAELNDIADYSETFEDLFPDGITEQNLASAIAAFERTLISDGSAFDQYADGATDALNAQQRRGLGIFRSAATRCNECHTLPTFSGDDFRVTGVPGSPEDIGYGALVEGNAMDYAFKIPTLRNTVLSGPYMHNGEYSTLEEIVDFYAKGGG